MTEPSAPAASKAKKRLPILQGLLPIESSRIPVEMIAGVTLAGLNVRLRKSSRGSSTRTWPMCTGVPAPE